MGRTMISWTAWAVLALSFFMQTRPLSAQPVQADPPFACNEPLALPRAREIVGKIQSAYNTVKNLSANFTQNSYLAALEQSELSSGKMWFLKPGRMRWDYLEPEKQNFVVRDQTLWLYQASENQVIIEEFSKVLISELPVGFLMGLGDLARDFHLERVCQTDDGYVLELAPKIRQKTEAAESLEHFSLLADTEQFLPIGAKVTDIGGNTTTLVLKGLEVNKGEVSATLFELNIPKGADIADRRGIAGDS